MPHPSRKANQDNGDDDDDEPVTGLQLDSDDHNLVPHKSTPTANATFIPIPQVGPPATPIHASKKNIPSLLGPVDHLGRSSITREQRKKRGSNEFRECTTPNGKRQNRDNRSRGQGKGVIRTLYGESHETNCTTPPGTNRDSTGRSKSDQLKEGLAGGFTPTKNMASNIPNQEDLEFEIPYKVYDVWNGRRKKIQNTMTLDTDPGTKDEKEDELEIEGGSEAAKSQFKKLSRSRMRSDLKPTQWEVTNSIPLTYFRRGAELLNQAALSISSDSAGHFKICDGPHEVKRLRFLLNEVKQVMLNETKDYVHIHLDRQRIEFPCGEQIWWKLKTPCSNLKERFFPKIHCELMSTDKIEEREKRFIAMLPSNTPPSNNPVYDAIQGYERGPGRPEIGSHGQSTEIRSLRNTRGRNAPGAKPATSFDVDAPLYLPTRPQFEMSQAEKDLPPLVWPPSGKKRVTVDYQDLERLQEEQFLNDNIINFYLRYLEEELARENPSLAQQTHFFNTFFYERLSQKTADRKANLQALMKWTARVDLFAKQYVIIPINENAHWYLAIICNLPHLEGRLQTVTGNSQDEEAPVVSTPESTVEEDEASELELPSAAEAPIESPERMAIDDPDRRRPTTAESQLLSELSNVELEKPPEPMDIDEQLQDDEDEWPNEEGLEGKNPEPINELMYSDTDKVAQEDDTEIIVHMDDPHMKRGRKQKKQPVKVKKPPKQVDTSAPTIFILDSLRTGRNTRTFSLLKEYLVEEALQKKQLNVPRGEVGGSYAKVPIQSNWCDCGVYLLYYVQRFLECPQEFTQEFIRKAECTPKFDLSRFPCMRQELSSLIKKLHHEQHGDAVKDAVDSGHSMGIETKQTSWQALPEENQEARYEGGGPYFVGHGLTASKRGYRPEVPNEDMDLVNKIQSQRFTPELEHGKRIGPGPTSSRHFHPSGSTQNNAHASGPPSLQSSPSRSPEPTPIMVKDGKASRYPPLSLPKKKSASEHDDYAMSVDRVTEGAVYGGS